VVYCANAGGFIVSFALTMPIWRRRGGLSHWQKIAGQPPHPEAKYSRSKSGIPSIPRRRKN
jgi:hypothetical protein